MMCKIPTVAVALAAMLAAAQATPSSADVVYEDKGLYKKETWNIQKYYDDLDDPSDAPGIITKGRDPGNPSGPAVDFERRPGSLGLSYDRQEARERQERRD